MGKPKKTLFKNIYTQEKNSQLHFCYRTGMTVYEENFKNGRFMAEGWNTAGYMLNVLDDIPTRLNTDEFIEAQAFDLEADGMSLSWDWSYEGFEQNTEILENGTELLHGIITLKSDVKPILAKVHTRLDGEDVFERWIEVRNVGNIPININVASPMCGGIELIDNWKDHMLGTPDSSKIYSLGYMSHSSHSHEGSFKWHDLTDGIRGIDGKYQFDLYRHPMFMLRNNLFGKIMIAQLGWSGGYRFDFTLNTDTTDRMRSTSRLSFKMELKGQNPITILAPNESFRTPSVHIGMLAGGLDDAVNSMHKHLRHSVFTLPAARGVKGWAEGGMGPERIMDIKATKHFADTLAQVGAETLIIDAGWYCPIGKEVGEWWNRAGDWYPDPEHYPNGIEEIRDYIHSKGLLFGLWLDLERLGPLSKAAVEHPEWRSKCFYRGTNNTQLNMAIPEAAQWAEKELSRVIEEYKIDLFRLDYNLELRELQNRYEGVNGTENGFIRYYQNANAMYERLRRKYPNVIFENCAGGGGRTDVGFVANFTHTWVSDHNVAPRSFSITNGMTMALPPEYVDRLVSGMNCHTMAELKWQVRNTIFGRPSTNDYNAVGSDFNPNQIETVKHTFDIYKKHIRPYIGESLIFHHTPELLNDPSTPNALRVQPSGTGIIERASEDGCHGVIGIFNLASTGETVQTIYPKGIDSSLVYKVTLDNSGEETEISGSALKNQGIRVTLPCALTSELIIYEAKE